MLFLAELRKLLSIRLLLIAVVLSALYGHVFLATNFERLTTDHPTLEMHQITVRASTQFGSEISDTDYQEWSRQYVRLQDKADILIEADPTLRGAGITTWDELTLATNKDDEKASTARAAGNPLLFAGTPGKAGIGYSLQTLRDLLDQYADIRTHGIKALPHQTAADRQDSQNRLHSGAWRTIQDQGLLTATFDFARGLTILVVLVVLLVTAPLPVTDTVRRMRSVQYASKRGREVFTAQFLATLAAALLAGLVACFVAGVILSVNQAEPFLNNSLWSYMTGFQYRENQTLLSALIIAAIILLLTAIATGAISFVLGRWSNHYTGLLVRLVVAFAIFTTAISSLLSSPLTSSNPVWQLLQIPGAEILVSVLLAALGLLVGALLVRREHSHDLM